MKRNVISTKHAPAAVGPYSQGVRAGHFLFTAGQIALDPATGKMVEGDAAAQTHQVMQNLQAILQEVGSSFDDVVKTTVFLQDMNLFSEMNGVYGQFFEGEPPARSTVAVAGLPLGALLEIEAIVLIPHQ
jgi:2-iminobutanoate/2-iminopropanoate deaminase